MKKYFYFLTAILIAASSFISCSQAEDGKGILVVENKAGDTEVVIKNVLAQEKNSSEYVSVYSEKILNKDSYYISVDEGEYRIKIETEKTYTSGIKENKFYETGYNIYKKINSSSTAVVTFDGSGIYFQ